MWPIYKQDKRFFFCFDASDLKFEGEFRQKSFFLCPMPDEFCIVHVFSNLIKLKVIRATFTRLISVNQKQGMSRQCKTTIFYQWSE